MKRGFIKCNPDNICRVNFNQENNPVNPDYHLPSISEMVAEARKTGQMPYSNQRDVSAVNDTMESVAYPAFMDAFEQRAAVEQIGAEIQRLEKERDDALEKAKAELKPPVSPEVVTE